MCFSRSRSRPGLKNTAPALALALCALLPSSCPAQESGSAAASLPVSEQEAMSSRIREAAELAASAAQPLQPEGVRSGALFKSFSGEAQRLSSAAQERLSQGVEGLPGAAGSARQRSLAPDPSLAPAPAANAGPQGSFDLLLFISFGLDDATIREIYAANAGSKRVALVLRGLVKGTSTINATAKAIQAKAAELGLRNPPSVLINPVWFKQYGITKVPAVVALERPAPARSGDPSTGRENKGPAEIARAYGLVDALPLVRKIEEGRRGDLGIMGPVAEIQERDLIEEMQDRASKIDWEGRKRAALARAWENQPVEPLEKAREARLRTVNPEFEVTRDITAPDPQKPGKTLVIARKGERRNPLEIRKFPHVILVTDPTDKAEDGFIRSNLADKLRERGLAPQQLMVVICNADRKAGWDGYDALVREYNRHVWVLTPEMKARFMLERHPALVWAEGNRFKVEEFAP